MSDHPSGPAQHARAPGWQVLQVVQPVAITVTDHSQTISESARLVPKYGHRFRRYNLAPKIMILTSRGSYFCKHRIYRQHLDNPVRRRKTWALFCNPCIFPNFETLPLHSTPCHPQPTQHLPRYLRVISFLLCRVARSLACPHSTRLLLLGHSLPGLPTSHGGITSPLYTVVTASAPLWSRPSARAGTGHVTTPPPARRDC